MSFLSKFIPGSKLRAENARLKAELSNRYDGAMMGGTQRPWIPAYVRDARFDANQWTRWELTRKIRDLACNVWLVTRLWELYIRYSVGPNGLQVVPATGNKDWDNRMAEAFAEWCECPCKDSRWNIRQVHRIMAGETHIDGEVFLNLTSRKPNGSRSVPAIQLLESHRIGTSGGDVPLTSEQGVIDGVRVDAAGRPYAYDVRDGLDGQERTTIHAYDRDFPQAGGILHVYNPERVGMYRAVTPYHSCINDLQDFVLLDSLEMDRAKAASAIANILVTQTGEIPNNEKLIKDFALGGLSKFGSDPKAAQKWDELTNRIAKLQTVLGARTVAIKPGEDIKQLAQANPSAATQWYWQFKINQICIANGIPTILVLPESMQGTVTRGVIDDANSYFKSQFHHFAGAAKAIYHFYADWARYNVPGLQDAPANWRKCHVPPPREIGVDVGRDAAAKLLSYAAGTVSLDDIVGPLGTTAERVTRRKAHDIARIKLIAAEVSAETGVEVKPEEIASSLTEVMLKSAMSEQFEGLGEQAEANADAVTKGKK